VTRRPVRPMFCLCNFRSLKLSQEKKSLRQFRRRLRCQHLRRCKHIGSVLYKSVIMSSEELARNVVRCTTELLLARCVTARSTIQTKSD